MWQKNPSPSTSPRQPFLNYINYLKYQNKYSKWAKMDTSLKKVFTGTHATPGFISAWESDDDDVGKGEQEIVKNYRGRAS